MASIIERAVGSMDDKRRWRAHKARVRALPPAHRDAAEAVERYVVQLGAVILGDLPTGPLMAMLDDLADRFERAATAGETVGRVVGDNPTRFVEALLETHLGARWAADPAPGVTAVEREVHRHLAEGVAKERRRMLAIVARVSA